MNTRRILGAQADVEKKLLPQKIGKGRSGIGKKLPGSLEVIIPQTRSSANRIPQRAPRGQAQPQGRTVDEEVFLLPIVDRRRGTFQQPLLTELGGEVPPVLRRRMAFEGIKMPKQGERRLNLDYVAEGEKSYQKPKGIRGHGSEGDVQEAEEGSDKGRKRKPESGTERFLIQTKATGRGSAGPVRGAR